MVFTDDLVLSKTGMVKAIIRKHFKYAMLNIPAEDLYQAGCLYLVEALDKYDKDKSSNMDMYLYTMIKNNLLMYIMKNRSIVCISRHAQEKMFENERTDDNYDTEEIVKMFQYKSLNSMNDDGDEMIQLLEDKSTNVEESAIFNLAIEKLFAECTDVQRDYVEKILKGYTKAEISKCTNTCKSNATRILKRVGRKYQMIA